MIPALQLAYQKGQNVNNSLGTSYDPSRSFNQGYDEAQGMRETQEKNAQAMRLLRA